jgi:hypothetical protein
MDLLGAWASMGSAPKASFLFVFAISALTGVRLLRLALWTVRPDAAGAPGQRVRTAIRWARSTRGHAQAALWLTGAAATAGLAGAYANSPNSARPLVLYIIDDSVRIMDAAAVGLVICAALFAIASIFDVAVYRFAGRRPDTGAVMRATRRLLGIVGLVAVAHALAEFRPNLESRLAGDGESGMPGAAMLALGLVWGRLAPIAASIGLLTWLAVVVETRYGRPGSNDAVGGCA